jgi:type II secretory pathway pseudopilin PulG
MTKLAIILAIIGIAYWYWSGPYQQSTQVSEADRLQDNAAVMQRCINQEQRMQSTGGLAGVADVGSSGADAEKLCAEKNNLYKRDGDWYSRND